MPNNKKNFKSRTPSVEETNARLDKECAQQNSQGQDLPPKEGESKVRESRSGSRAEVAAMLPVCTMYDHLDQYKA